ncbi:MAG: hypothetical protein WC659_05600 [Patescibacteria group bacterium]
MNYHADIRRYQPHYLFSGVELNAYAAERRYFIVSEFEVPFSPMSLQARKPCARTYLRIAPENTLTQVPMLVVPAG